VYYVKRASSAPNFTSKSLAKLADERHALQAKRADVPDIALYGNPLKKCDMRHGKIEHLFDFLVPTVYS
jgi:hypothetical protein